MPENLEDKAKRDAENLKIWKRVSKNYKLELTPNEQFYFELLRLDTEYSNKFGFVLGGLQSPEMAKKNAMIDIEYESKCISLYHKYSSMHGWKDLSGFKIGGSEPKGFLIGCSLA